VSNPARETIDRRTALGTLGSAAATALAGCGLFERGEDAPTTGVGDTPGADDGSTTGVDEEEARDLAARFAPTIYFDTAERWFPTDPRPYESEGDGETVVDGFDAFDGYTDRYEEGPPDPRVFYNVVQYEGSPLAAVQYWMYSAFDQFTANFHWHDWEVLHVFVDTDTGDPQLYVASSHSRTVPNNEFLDPETDVPRILSELGSHSSALSVNEERDRFQRLPTDGLFADITNTSIEGLEDLAEIPLAYGLPRDEGSRLPYVVPELDGAPLYEHERLPAVAESDLVDGDLVVRSFDALASPPSELPSRETGVVFGHVNREEDADVGYELTPASDLEHIADFTGPQLSFEFAIPEFVEDAVASHITTTAVPWQSPRYENPAADISDPNHRAALADRYDAIGAPAPVNSVIASVRNAVTADDAPEDEGLTTEETTVESVALLESDPEAVPTFGGVVAAQDVSAGDHQLSVNGAGVAPHSEAVSVAEEGSTVAGAEGEIPLVALERARKLEIDPEAADSELTDLAVEDDFGGRLYDAPLEGPDAVYVHDGGAYTTEVRDTDDEVGAFRVNPGVRTGSGVSEVGGDEDDTGDDDDDGSRLRIEEPRTGKASLAAFLVDVTEETRAAVADAADVDLDDDTNSQPGGDGPQDGSGGQDGGSENAARGLVRALEAVTEAARRARERAEAKDRGQADEALARVAERLTRVAERLTEARGRGAVPDDVGRATERRLDQADRRAQQARAAEKLD
jgi:hypothetical protein